MRRLLYLIGEPGAGKTTLLAAAINGLTGEARAQPVAHIAYANGAQIGAQRETFGGTDALPLNAQPRVLSWLADAPFANVVAEGDRLANNAFFTAICAQGWRLTVVLLDTPGDEAARRRAARGTVQNATWVKGRITKVQALAERWVFPTWRLDGALAVDVLAAQLRAHPVIDALREV